MAMADAPLKGLRVIEMGSLIAGPFCGQVLGDFGAEVIKLEDPKAGDPMRQWGRTKPKGHSPWWPVIGRNKSSVTLDLRAPEGRDVARALIATADVVVENFRPGTLEKWGMSQTNSPRLAACRARAIRSLSSARSATLRAVSASCSSSSIARAARSAKASARPGSTASRGAGSSTVSRPTISPEAVLRGAQAKKRLSAHQGRRVWSGSAARSGWATTPLSRIRSAKPAGRGSSI